MTLRTQPLWPARIRRPWLRLAVAMVAAPLLLAALLTGLEFLLAGATEPTRDAVLAVTLPAAIVFFAVLPAFALTFGLAAVAALWALGRPGIAAWALAGAVAGLALAIGQGLMDGAVPPFQLAVGGGMGLAMLLLIRWIAGVRVS